MKKESRDEILRAYDDACRLLKLDNFPAFIRFLCGELQKNVRMLKQARTREGLEAQLVKEPEPSPEQLAAIAEAIRLLPYRLRKALPDAAKEAAKQLPHLPGGRPRSLKPDEYPRVCKAIGSLIAEGTKLKDAQQRIAQKEGCSLRTVQRVWQSRRKIAHPGPTTNQSLNAG